MLQKQMLEKILCVVDRTLRNEFPEDFHKRCMYAAFGVRELLRNLDCSPVVVGGDFMAFVLSKDKRQASIQGYSSLGRSSEHSHYWVEVDGAVIDLGTYYLPIDSRFPAVAMPVTHWNLAIPFPKALQYHPEVRYDVNVELKSTVEITTKMERFLGLCRKRMEGSLVKPQLDTWLLSNPSSIKEAAKRGDLWASGAIRFEGMT